MGEREKRKNRLLGDLQRHFNQYRVSVKMRLGKEDEYNHTHACEPILTFAKTKNQSINKKKIYKAIQDKTTSYIWSVLLFSKQAPIFPLCDPPSPQKKHTHRVNHTGSGRCRILSPQPVSVGEMQSEADQRVRSSLGPH